MKQVYALISRLGLPFPTDKILHLIAGFLITVIFSYMAYMQGLDYPQAYGVIAGILAGIGKEAWDEYRFRKGKHSKGFDFFDMMATFIGVFVGGALVVLL